MHELRTPLNGIIGFSELLIDEEVGPLNATHKEYLGDLLISARYLLQLISVVLDLSEVEAGKVEIYPETFALPGMDGLTLTRIIKADANLNDIAVIAMTAFAMRGDDVKALAAGCGGCIANSIDTRRLVQKIETILSARTVG